MVKSSVYVWTRREPTHKSCLIWKSTTPRPEGNLTGVVPLWVQQGKKKSQPNHLWKCWCTMLPANDKNCGSMARPWMYQAPLAFWYQRSKFCNSPYSNSRQKDVNLNSHGGPSMEEEHARDASLVLQTPLKEPGGLLPSIEGTGRFPVPADEELLCEWELIKTHKISNSILKTYTAINLF